MAEELAHEPDAHRYVLRIDDRIASVVDYTVLGDALSMTRTFTNPTLRGRGLASKVVEFAVDDVEQNTKYQVVPMCWYVAQWFDEHPERANLLSARSA
ncbi:GNAT family N-acetyltransferase [Humibacter albus]|uniref:GNAT family N-acetyltransferase n=1 Tax=Humibacter albus TaxID=427754 RepID=UPI0003B39BDE|nr:GNAT family N-acetyltransferase [Humibacter albus]